MSELDRISPFQVEIPSASSNRLNWSRLYGSSKAVALVELAKQQDGLMLVLCKDNLSASTLLDELKFFAKGSHLNFLSLPDWETLPYDQFSPYQDIISERLQTLYSLSHIEQGIVVVPITTAMHRLLPANYLQQHSIQIQKGESISLEEFKQQLLKKGYRFVEQVVEHGDVAIRGSLVDLFPMGATYPFRVDLFDDEVDTIRSFDHETQRSIEKVDEIQILPASEIALTDEGIANFRQSWRAKFEGNPNDCPIYKDITQAIAPAGIEYYLPLFYLSTDTLFDYFSDSSLIIIDEAVRESMESFWEDVESRYEQTRHDRERPVLKPREIFLNEHDVFNHIKPFQQIHITSLSETENVTHEFATHLPKTLTVDARANEPTALLEHFLNEFSGRVLVVAETAGRRETLLELFKQTDRKPHEVENWQSFITIKEDFCITVSPLEQGLLIDEPSIAVISESQLFGERVMQRRLRRRKKTDAEAVVKNLTELRIDAPVVHEDHGVGRYKGLITMTVGEVEGEFIMLEYADEDKLYVPVASLDLISRYTGADPDHAPLHKLGGGQWLKAKRKAAERAYDVAAELLDLHAKRAARPGMVLSVEQDAYRAFVQSFPFEETPGQIDAIDAVLEDMQKPTPMDRLVCGDAGFGKTEVAMRAAFIATQNLKQVVVLVPTTLLAQQHFQNFRDRFADWPVRVELLSRFRSAKEEKAVIADLEAGKVDIVIGTHKLIQGDIDYKDLGLVIIDEEHRFGVRQKEKIKSLRAEIDVLTLTATPIPRTLNMALSDLRALSIIATPPSRRLAVKTFVREWNDALMKEALLREIKRGGQVFFLHNEVKSIEKKAKEIEKLLPEARVRFAHGQMAEKELEVIMLDFYHRRFNVLVCTTIVETGIDIPTANTIIINRADKFGLAQLYQLRGRVGRSHHRAYAYLIVPPRKLMTGDAIKRLEAIESLEELGIGFTLATHDLEIRGAGEILGEEQSGQIHEIGFGMYMELLDRAVKALKEGKQVSLDRALDHGTEIDLRVPSLIPDDFLPDVHMRLIIYKRIASAKDRDELQDLQEEVIDRFGLIPSALNNLFKITALKLRTTPIGIRKIDLGAKGGRVLFDEQTAVDPVKIIELIQNDPARFRLEGQDKIRIYSELPDAESRLEILYEFLDRIGA